MLLSFSEPAMLPMVINGLVASGGHDENWADGFQTACNQYGGLHCEPGREKRQTIRAFDPATSAPKSPYRRERIGKTAHIWWKQRSPERFKIGTAVIKTMRPIWMAQSPMFDFEVKIDGRALSQTEIETLAHDDGFDSVAAFRDFFLPRWQTDGFVQFYGVLIAW